MMYVHGDGISVIRRPSLIQYALHGYLFGTILLWSDTESAYGAPSLADRGLQLSGVIRVDRANIAYVPQEIPLLDDSIRNNLLFGLSGWSDGELMKALKTAKLDDFDDRHRPYPTWPQRPRKKHRRDVFWMQ